MYVFAYGIRLWILLVVGTLLIPRKWRRQAKVYIINFFLLPWKTCANLKFTGDDITWFDVNAYKLN